MKKTFSKKKYILNEKKHSQWKMTFSMKNDVLDEKNICYEFRWTTTDRRRHYNLRYKLRACIFESWKLCRQDLVRWIIFLPIASFITFDLDEHSELLGQRPYLLNKSRHYNLRYRLRACIFESWKLCRQHLVRWMFFFSCSSSRSLRS